MSDKQKDFDEFDDFVNQLQDEIDAKVKEDFSEYALKLAQKPYLYGKLDETKSDVVRHLYRGPCGDAIILYLKIQDEKIVDLRYETDGCTTSSIAGSQLVKMIENKSLKDALNLTPQDILEALGKFPKENHHCALLAVDTMKQTIQKYKEQSN